MLRLILSAPDRMASQSTLTPALAKVRRMREWRMNPNKLQQHRNEFVQKSILFATKRLCFFFLYAFIIKPQLFGQTLPAPSHSTTPVNIAPTAFIGKDDVIIADFEQDGYGDGWEVEGTAFGKGPVKGNLPWRDVASGYLGRGFVDSRLEGDKGQGTLTSPEITVVRKYIRFLIAGANYAGKTCVNLIQDGKIVRSSMGPARKFEVLQPEEWDVSEFLGKKVRIQIVDHSSAWVGHILVDQILQGDAQFVKTRQMRELVANGKYLLLPVSNKGNYWSNVTVSSGNEALLKFDLSLAADKPDWWAFVEVPPMSGSLSVEVDKLPNGSKGLENIVISNEATGYTPYQDTRRPQLHYTPRCGYVGDPNGLVYHEGKWHLFYQHNRFSMLNSVGSWGHATSRDLIYWEEQSDALSSPLNKWPCLSGSAIRDKDNSAGFGKNALVAFSTCGGEFMFYSTDGGQTFKPWERNPVVSHAGRDPRVFWHEPTQYWVMVVYDEAGGKQRNVIYTSTNLKEWLYQSAVDGFFECPEFFELPVDGNPKDTAWLMFGANKQYLPGK